MTLGSSAVISVFFMPFKARFFSRTEVFECFGYIPTGNA